MSSIMIAPTMTQTDNQAQGFPLEVARDLPGFIHARHQEGGGEKHSIKTFTGVASNIINAIFDKKQKRNIWENSEWAHIADLENDDVGKAGENIINEFCAQATVQADIDGLKTKELGGGSGDGIINGKTVEIKTARLGSNGSSFQHELGEVPWTSEFMIFLDIAPENMYITIFPNFTEAFYKNSGRDSKIKCTPYFPTKSICWRKQQGAFKLDTTLAINNKNEFTFIFDANMTDWNRLSEFINSIIQ